MAKIYIDAGHGGKDSGAVGNGIYEKDIVLDVSNRIAAGLADYENTTVILSRSSDIYLSLNERTKKANNAGADILVSVHINAAANKSAKGFESFRYINTDAATIAFQNVLHGEIIKAMGSGIIDRGKKQKDLHMVRESNMIACLTENLFISNAGDAAKLKDDAFKQRIAEGHIAGIVKYLGLKKKAGSIRQPDNIKSDKLYKVQVGAFSKKINADGLIKDLEMQGFSAFVTIDDGLFLVQAGAYKNKENAEALIKELKKKGYRPFIKYE